MPKVVPSRLCPRGGQGGHRGDKVKIGEVGIFGVRAGAVVVHVSVALINAFHQRSTANWSRASEIFGIPANDSYGTGRRSTGYEGER